VRACGCVSARVCVCLYTCQYVYVFVSTHVTNVTSSSQLAGLTALSFLTSQLVSFSLSPRPRLSVSTVIIHSNGLTVFAVCVNASLLRTCVRTHAWVGRVLSRRVQCSCSCSLLWPDMCMCTSVVGRWQCARSSACVSVWMDGRWPVCFWADCWVVVVGGGGLPASCGWVHSLRFLLLPVADHPATTDATRWADGGESRR